VKTENLLVGGNKVPNRLKYSPGVSGSMRAPLLVLLAFVGPAFMPAASAAGGQCEDLRVEARCLVPVSAARPCEAGTAYACSLVDDFECVLEDDHLCDAAPCITLSLQVNVDNPTKMVRGCTHILPPIEPDNLPIGPGEPPSIPSLPLP
jgi:hypothetical protein